MVGDGTKNGLPAPNKELAINRKHHLTRKAPYKFESGLLQRRVCCEPELLQDRKFILSVQSDKRARSSSTFAISSWRRGFLASDVSAKSRIRYRASAAASAHVVDGAARACLSNSSWRRRRAA